jgi:hypothetical protein
VKGLFLLSVKNIEMNRHCERSDAIQKAKKQGLDCFAADAPRNDE